MAYTCIFSHSGVSRARSLHNREIPRTTIPRRGSRSGAFRESLSIVLPVLCVRVKVAQRGHQARERERESSIPNTRSHRHKTFIHFSDRDIASQAFVRKGTESLSMPAAEESEKRLESLSKFQVTGAPCLVMECSVTFK